MANQEQLAILKQGVKIWNEWRSKSNGVDIDLAGADLKRAHLSEAHLGRADLSGANLRIATLTEAFLRGTNLTHADLGQANLGGANLSEANLKETNLNGADLSGADLGGANLSRAYLIGTELGEADLSEANLDGSNLSRANLNGAKFGRANLSGTFLMRSNFLKARMGSTSCRDLDLSEAIGLEDIVHWGPSNIATDTFARSKGKIPETFLRGCGLSDWEIESAKLYNPDLNNEEINKTLYKVYDLRASQAIQISPLFISYSHGDSSFIDKIEVRLNEKGVRFWRDIHDLKSGRIETQIDRAIRQNPTVLLILSELSIQSDWVEHEVRTARELEKEMGRDVLCPVALDDSWKDSPWPKRVMEQVMEYNILDFSAWEDDGKFGNTFNKLIDGLGLFYKG